MVKVKIWGSLAETTGSASISLTEDNIIGGLKVTSLDKNTRFNRVFLGQILN